MSTATDQVQEPVEAEADDRDHIYCCNNQEAICGTDLSEYEVECEPECIDHPTCMGCWVLYKSDAWRCRFCGLGWVI